MEDTNTTFENQTTSQNGNQTLSTVEHFQFYFLPIMVYLGIIGNGLSVYVFFKTKLRKLSSSYYLAALAVSDNIFLGSLFIVWLRMLEIDLYNKPVMCKMLTYVTGVSGFLSVWLILAFTAERFVAVRYPLLRQSVCTVSRAKTVITILSILALTFSSPLLIFVHLEYNGDIYVCTVNPVWQELVNIFNYCDSVVTFIIPVVVIVILNVCISRTLWKLAAVRKRLTHRGAQPQGLHSRKGAQTRLNRTRPNPALQNKVTKMLLVVSTVCLCLSLPSYITRVLADLIALNVIKLEGINHLAFLTTQQWCQTLYYTNFGINFALYCISGQNFRKALRSLLSSTARLRRNETVPVTESRTQSSGSSATSKRRKTTQSTYLESQELATLNLYIVK